MFYLHPYIVLVLSRILVTVSSFVKWTGKACEIDNRLILTFLRMTTFRKIGDFKQKKKKKAFIRKQLIKEFQNGLH